MSTIRKVIFSIILFQSALGRIVLVILILLFIPSTFGQGNSKFDFLLKNTNSPKYEIYAQYFNPFKTSKTNYQFDFGFKWKHKSEKFYWRSNIVFRGFVDKSNYEILTFAPMARLTLKKVPWMHLELSAGASFVHRNYTTQVYFNRDAFGLGTLMYGELQFDIGNRFNIALNANICPSINYNITHPNPNSPYPKPNNVFTSPVFVQEFPILRVNFTLYF